MLNRFIYQAFGLSIYSEIPLSELEKQLSPQEADVNIVYKNLEREWAEKPAKKILFVEEQTVMFYLKDVAIFKIVDGNKIMVSPVLDANEDQIKLYVLGTCMGALLLQRKVLPLHGSCVEYKGKALAIVGDSGVGKSTLANALLRIGCKLLSDDIIPVIFNADGKPFVTPSYPQQKLWQESLQAFGVATNQFKPIFAREKKFLIPTPHQFYPQPLQLHGVFELEKGTCSEVTFSSTRSIERIQRLYQHTYRNFLISRLQLQNWHFQTSSKVATQVPLFRITRPENKYTVDEIVSYITNKIEEQ